VNLPFVTEEPFPGPHDSVEAKCHDVEIKIPGFGKINVYNTHLCAFCDPSDRSGTSSRAGDFIEDVENFVLGENP